MGFMGAFEANATICYIEISFIPSVTINKSTDRTMEQHLISYFCYLNLKYVPRNKYPHMQLKIIWG